MIKEIDGSHIITTTGMITKDQLEACAMAVHEFNRAYCLAIGDLAVPASQSWEDCPKEMQESMRQAVLCAINGEKAEGIHESWLAAKITANWIYGPVKDYTKKTHPCLLPYDKLPPQQRQKDANTIAVVQAMCEALKIYYVCQCDT